jgi:hypothetical protein
MMDREQADVCDVIMGSIHLGESDPSVRAFFGHPCDGPSISLAPQVDLYRAPTGAQREGRGHRLQRGTCSIGGQGGSFFKVDVADKDEVAQAT